MFALVLCLRSYYRARVTCCEASDECKSEIYREKKKSPGVREMTQVRHGVYSAWNSIDLKLV